MILVRTVMQAQFGRGGELAAAFAESTPKTVQEINAQGRWRLLTDLSGPFDTVVLEVEAESLADAEQRRAELFRSASFQESMARTQGMIVSGRNELYTIEAEG